MGRGMTKAERLRELERLYYQGAYTDQELAERFDVNRSTINRLRRELEQEIPFIQNPDGRYRIDRQRYLSSVRLNVREALSLYLAARRASHQTRIGQRPMANALEKLALSLRQPMTERLVRSAEAVLSQEIDPQREEVFETVANAWVDRLRLRIEYQGLGTRHPYRDRISPYLIEPSPWSDGVYVIGPSEIYQDIITYRLDRIRRARLTTEKFELPGDFDEEELLRYAWGIWRGKGEPQEVVLHFAPGPAAKRVQESKWHPLEHLEILEDGSVIWRALIAEWREMLPWIRGWGADVTVLAPETLRERLRQETQRLSAIYLADRKPVPAWFHLWAKTDQTTGQVHPLLYHLIDVGVTAQAMWQSVISIGERTQFTRTLGFSDEEAGRFFAFLIATHDLGKASPAFQEKASFARPILERAGFHFPAALGRRGAPHGYVTTWALHSLLPAHLNISRRDARKLAHVIGGHHGVWPVAKDILDLSRYDKGDEGWANAREEIFQILLRVFDPPRTVSLPDQVHERNALLMFLSGFVTAADWVGSMSEYFEYEERFMDAQAYASLIAPTAHRALEETGWIGWRAEGQSQGFTEIFPFSPNHVQETVFRTALEAPLPALVILEAPTGSGKTEAALYLADVWLQRRQGKGMYIAMPTQATSNQMFQRTAAFLQQRYPRVPVNFHLVHGNAAWTEQMKEIRLAGIGEKVEDGLVAQAWFLPRKRTLLAPFGVGTVDQSFLSVLQTRHFFLRLFGLGCKVLVFDEVHAYDTYMSQLFLRLLAWLRVMGTSVIVLSATLPESTRRAMAAAYLGEHEDDLALGDAPYPRLTLASSAETKTVPIPQSAARTVKLSWLDAPADNLEPIAHMLAEQLNDGGCAAVVCNTVNRAQEVYTLLKEARIVNDDALYLFHARTPFAWRKKVENAVLRAFGKPDPKGHSPYRPRKAIVVATQVIEQSLDLDFDLMVSELAPVDLIIQRIGRLHRHPRDRRPPGLSNPQVYLLRPQGDLTSPDFGPTEYIYDRYLLWQTWLTLQHRGAIRLPGETTELIGAVYGPFRPADLSELLRTPLQKAHAKMVADFRRDRYEAQIRLVPAPSEEGLVTHQQLALLDDDDPRVHEQLRAVTRLIGPTLNLVCLHRTSKGVFLEPDGSGPAISLEEEPPRPLIRELMQRAVTIQHMGVIRCLKDKLPHASWKSVAALRYHLPIVFENGVYTLEDGLYTLILDRELGLRIQKEK